MGELVEYIRIALSWYHWKPQEDIVQEDIEAFKKLECYMRRHRD